MMFCRLYQTLIVSAVVLWLTLPISFANKSGDLKDPSEIFHEHHKAVVTVITSRNKGTGFCIEPREYVIKRTGKVFRFVVTAFHVVKDASKVDVYLYQDEKDNKGNWKYEICRAEIYGLDIVRDVALIAVPCDTCNCKRLGSLPTRHSTVNVGESVVIVGDSTKRRPHSFVDGRLSDTNFTYPLMTLFYQLDKDVATATRVHGLTGSVNLGDSGSAVMDITGKVIGMISAMVGDLNYCVTMEEISKAHQQILDTLSPRFVACTARESALLGRTSYWGGMSGKSIKEMNALAIAMNTHYFAVAHDGLQAHAFMFHTLWWDILPGNNYMKEHPSQCLCEMNSFIDAEVLEPTKEGKVMCGCAENACRRNRCYQKRFGEDNDRRWAIYERMNKNPEQNVHYVPSKESLASMKDIAGEITYWKKKVDILEREKEGLVSLKNDAVYQIHYWKEKANNLRIEKAGLVSEYKSYMAIGIAVAVCICFSMASSAIGLYKQWKNILRMLNVANAERDRLRARLSQQEMLQNSEPTNAPTGPP